MATSGDYGSDLARQLHGVDRGAGAGCDKTAVLFSDDTGAYRAFADTANIVHVQINLTVGEHTWGVYHVPTSTIALAR